MKTPVLVLAGAFSSIGSLQALYIQPWNGNVYEFIWDSSYEYSRFVAIRDTMGHYRSPGYSHRLTNDLAFTLSPEWMFELELELVQSAYRSFGWQSVALQARYQILDDIIGDYLSLTTGMILRTVATSSIKDFTSPYHGQFNPELFLSLGKESSEEGFWNYRGYGQLFFGQSNRGYPWVRGIAVWEMNNRDQYRLGLFLNGYRGFGHQVLIPASTFNGYSQIKHRSIDVGGFVGWDLYPYGLLEASYARRVFARSYPTQVNTFQIEYRLPFSIF